MSEFDRMVHLLASTRLHRPGMKWEWRISRDVWDSIRPPGWGFGAQVSVILGLPVKVMEDATPGTIGLVA